MKKTAAFSLVEVTLAIGIIAFGLIAIIGLLPVGMNSGRESVDVTHAQLVAQDVFDRIRAYSVSNDSTNSKYYFGPYATGIATFFFYSSEGVRSTTGAATGELVKVQYPNDRPAFYANIHNPSDFYRAKVIVSLADQSVGYNQTDPRFASNGNANLLCATVEIGWPVNYQDGSLVGNGTKKMVYTFLLRKP